MWGFFSDFQRVAYGINRCAAQSKYKFLTVTGVTSVIFRFVTSCILVEVYRRSEYPAACLRGRSIVMMKVTRHHTSEDKNILKDYHFRMFVLHHT